MSWDTYFFSFFPPFFFSTRQDLLPSFFPSDSENGFYEIVNSGFPFSSRLLFLSCLEKDLSVKLILMPLPTLFLPPFRSFFPQENKNNALSNYYESSFFFFSSFFPFFFLLNECKSQKAVYMFVRIGCPPLFPFSPSLAKALSNTLSERAVTCTFSPPLSLPPPFPSSDETIRSLGQRTFLRRSNFPSLSPFSPLEGKDCKDLESKTEGPPPPHLPFSFPEKEEKIRKRRGANNLESGIILRWVSL